MKVLFLSVLLSLPVWAVNVNVVCNGDEVIVATDKINNELKGAYICSKEMKVPVAIIKNENFDDKLDMEDSISFYVSAAYKGNRKFLKNRFESFEERFKEHQQETGAQDAYFQVDFKDLYDQAEIDALMKMVAVKITGKKSNLDEEFFQVDGSLRKRYYDPYSARFLSEDPKGFASGDPNFYRYVKNNPLIRRDPYGLDFRICSRPLNMSLPDANPFKHYYVRFPDDSTISYGVDGNGNPSELNEPSKPRGESCGKTFQVPHKKMH